MLAAETGPVRLGRQSHQAPTFIPRLPAGRASTPSRLVCARVIAQAVGRLQLTCRTGIAGFSAGNYWVPNLRGAVRRAGSIASGLDVPGMGRGGVLSKAT